MSWSPKGLLSLFSNDLAIDLGTANTLVHVRDRGIVMSEPSGVAIDAKTVEPGRWEIFTHGGRKPTGIDAIAHAVETAVTKKRAVCRLPSSSVAVQLRPASSHSAALTRALNWMSRRRSKRSG